MLFISPADICHYHVTVFPSTQLLFRPEHDLLVDLDFVAIPGWFEVRLYRGGGWIYVESTRVEIWGESAHKFGELFDVDHCRLVLEPGVNRHLTKVGDVTGVQFGKLFGASTVFLMVLDDRHIWNLYFR